MEKFIFAGSIFIAYIVQTISGFAGNVFAMPIGISLIGLHESVAVLNIVGFIFCAILAILNIKSVNWHEFIKICLVLMIFMFLGIWIDTVVQLDILLKLYGAIITIIGLKNLIFKNQKILPEWVLWIVLALSGIIQGMFVSGGALLIIYAIQKLKDPQEFRITLMMLWCVLNGIYGSISYFSGHVTPIVTEVVLIALPMVGLSMILGNILQKRIPKNKFLTLTYVLLVGIGLSLLIF